MRRNKYNQSIEARWSKAGHNWQRKAERGWNAWADKKQRAFNCVQFIYLVIQSLLIDFTCRRICCWLEANASIYPKKKNIFSTRVNLEDCFLSARRKFGVLGRFLFWLAISIWTFFKEPIEASINLRSRKLKRSSSSFTIEKCFFTLAKGES